MSSCLILWSKSLSAQLDFKLRKSLSESPDEEKRIGGKSQAKLSQFVVRWLETEISVLQLNLSPMPATVRVNTPDTFKPLLQKVVKTPGEFTANDTKEAFEHLLDPESTSPAQIGAFLTALHLSGADWRYDVLAAAASVLKAHCQKPIVQGREEPGIVVADIVGTGGDGHDTFNVSTSAAMVAAGAGVRICKHGNRAATSSSGSADLLMALGCPLQRQFTSLPASLPFSFLLAPHYHKALAPLVPIRKSLPFRTILNLLGPLVNPAMPDAMIVGVPKKALGAVFARALKEGGVKRGMVVCGFEGLDEISCAGGTWTWDVDTLEERAIHPADFGLEPHALNIVCGGSPEENAKILEELLTNPSEARYAAILDFVLMNASAVLVVAGLAKDYKEGVKLARESVRNGRARDALIEFREADKALSS